MKDALKNKIKQYFKKYFVNKETGAEIAISPDELPPLRKGYVRLIHQTNMEYANSLLENGLIYNREYANKAGFSKYATIGSMALTYTEDEFWERLTHEETRHRGADAIAIFDLPEEECSAHCKWFLTQYLDGTISRGYLVGVIPNYGTKEVDGDVKKLSVTEMEKMKKISQSNPLPPFYETPNWRENIKGAWALFQEQQEQQVDNFFGETQVSTQSDALQTSNEPQEEVDIWSDWFDTQNNDR